MVRKNNTRSLTDVFDKYKTNNDNNENQQETQPQQPVQETKGDDVTVNSNTNTVEEVETENMSPVSPTLEKTEAPVIPAQEEGEATSALTVEQVKHAFLNKYEEKVKKPTVEDTHTRTTFLFRNDLAKRLDKLSKGKRGFKTDFFNTAIEALLNEMEKK